jgi:hypothetical protein
MRYQMEHIQTHVQEHVQEHVGGMSGSTLRGIGL